MRNISQNSYIIALIPSSFVKQKCIRQRRPRSVSFSYTHASAEAAVAFMEMPKVFITVLGECPYGRYAVIRRSVPVGIVVRFEATEVAWNCGVIFYI